MDKIEIVMATYQGEKYLREQLDSILKNTYSNWQLSIYDDGSKDQTMEILKEYQANYPEKIQVTKNPKNLGHLKNFLTGAMKATADYVMFCDQDDVWNPDKIELTYQEMKRVEAEKTGKEPVVVFTDATVVDVNLQVICPSFHESGRLDTTKIDLNHLLMENKLIGCTTMVNRALLERLTVLPEQARFHDWWIGLIAAAFGTIRYLSVATLKYRQHGNNEVGNLSSGAYFVNRVSRLKAQRLALKKTYGQAAEFLQLYGQQLPEEKQYVMKQFAALDHVGFFKKRKIVIQYRFYKTGFVRNLGLLAIM